MTMNTEQPFIMDCDLHDYLEIACLFHYRVRMTLTDGRTVEGTAVTTGVAPGRVEVLTLDTGDGHTDLPLADLARMDVLTPNARVQGATFR